jgi:hypothetical protein
MKKSKLTIFICLAVFNVLLEVISSESSANSVTSQKFLKVKKFLKKMKDYKKTRFLISVAILLLSTSYNNHYLLNDPKLKPITFDFIEEDDFDSLEINQYFDFIGRTDVQNISKRIRRLIINNDLDSGESSIRISFELQELIRLLGSGRSTIFMCYIIRILLVGCIPGTSGMNRVIEAFSRLHKRGRISSKLMELLLEMFSNLYGATEPPSVDDLVKMGRSISAPVSAPA